MILKPLHPTVSNNRADTMRPSNKIPNLNTRLVLATKFNPWPKKVPSGENSLVPNNEVTSISLIIER